MTITLKDFTGINNVLQPHQLERKELVAAMNVDLNNEGSIKRRAGFSTVSATAHRNVFQAPAGFLLATRGGAGDLVNVTTDTVLRAALGHARIWWCALPDGRVAYSNGTDQGVVSAAGDAALPWGVPVPGAVGAAADAGGGIAPGTYQYAITYTRLADGAEGGPAYAAPIDLTLGLSLTALPVLAGHRINVYLTAANGSERFLAGTTLGATFAFAGAITALVRPCRTEFMQPPPVGRLLAFWRGRALLAVGNALFASRPNSWHLFDLRRDYKMFSADVTLVQPVTGGIWVGTDEELCFLEGDSWDKLRRSVKAPGRVVLGSGCAAPGNYVRKGDAVADGDAMVCIVDGYLAAGTSDGELLPLSKGRYQTTAAEVASTFRIVDGVPQYLAMLL